MYVNCCNFFLFNFFCSPFPFTADQVRIVLYRECDLRGTKLLFDSDAFTKINTTPSLQKVNGAGPKKVEESVYGHVYEICNGVSYKVSGVFI